MSGLRRPSGLHPGGRARHAATAQPRVQDARTCAATGSFDGLEPWVLDDRPIGVRRRLHLVAAFGLAVVSGAGACGEGSSGVGGAPLNRPTGAGEVVVQVLVDGGFVRPEVALATAPATTVLGDGTVITPAPTLAIYPGPALAPLQAAKVDAATVDGLLARAAKLGLLAGPLDFGRPPVADAPNTTVTIVADGRAHRHVAVALGISDEATGGASRRALKDFLSALEQLPPGNEAWEPSAIAVRVVGPYQADPQLPQPPVAWPLDRVPVEAGPGTPCLVVEGSDVGLLRAALARANARTPWLIGGVARSVVFVPVIPGSQPCPA